jgi:hypothetical protein
MSHQTENVIDLLAEKLATYLRSVEHADAELASTLWATSPEVSFIHPRGHERGWEQVGVFCISPQKGAIQDHAANAASAPIRIWANSRTISSTSTGSGGLRNS